MSERVFGTHEAEAMFDAISNGLAINKLETASGFLRELQKERGMLIDERRQVHLALLRDANDPAKAVAAALHILAD